MFASLAQTELTVYGHINWPLYSNTVIGTLAVDGWAVTFGTASSLYQM